MHRVRVRVRVRFRLLKKPSLDKENLSNYCPISHLSYLSKLTEKIVKTRLTEHLTNNNLLNPFQSAYIKSHSTETTLLSVHDHIIKAMSLQQVTCLTLLDLSAAFDTIDHSILLERLSSWFGITSDALSWIKSFVRVLTYYLSMACLRCETQQFALCFSYTYAAIKLC